VLTQGGRPFSVFTPYKRLAGAAHAATSPPGRWRRAGAPGAAPRRRRCPIWPRWALRHQSPGPEARPRPAWGRAALFDDFRARMGRYKARRDFPAVKGPSYLSVHLRFGTVSIREAVRAALDDGREGADTWLSELIWREFYQILWHYPETVGHAFRPEYEPSPGPIRRPICRLVRGPHRLSHRRRGHAPAQPQRLHAQPPAHDRRVLPDQGPGHVDWRAGRAPLRPHLNDFDLAANNRRLAVGRIHRLRRPALLSASSTPWFRIFNPVTQSENPGPVRPRTRRLIQFIRRYLPRTRGGRASGTTLHPGLPWHRARRCPSASMPSAMSLASTQPSGSTRRAASRASRPGPAARSRMCSPGAGAAASRRAACRLVRSGAPSA
jgi:deoxyribodipyrimidine photo-lyase